jgi:hypothetical protein
MLGGRECLEPGGIPSPQFPAKVQPLEGQLAERLLQRPAGAVRAQLAGVKVVAPSLGFSMDSGQVGIQGPERARGSPEAEELGMVAIASRLAAENRAGKQRLAPEGYQALRVEIPGMERPETHGVGDELRRSNGAA